MNTRIRDFRDAESFLDRRDRKKLKNNTYIERYANSIVIFLYRTGIISFRPDGNAVLNTDGWLTATTRNRLNEFGFPEVHQKNKVWYFGNHEFRDGMTVNVNTREITG